MVRRKLLLIGAISIAALCARAAEAEILIAMASAMTGPSSWFGEQYQRAAELAVDECQRQGRRPRAEG